MRFFLRSLTPRILLVAAAGLLPCLHVSTARADDATPKADVLVFTNGDVLAGKLDHESDGTVFFKSDNAGTVQVKWEKIKSLRTSGNFAVIEKGVRIKRRGLERDVPQGTLSLVADTVTVNSTQGTQQVPVKNIAYLVDEATFQKNVQRGQTLWQGVSGAVTAGVSTVNSTQNSQSVNTAVVLTRAVPAVTWMPARERTLLNFNSSYGKVTQPNTPTVKTDIIHGELQENEYFSPRFYLLQQAVFDHNFSQGLDLQQLYGIGVGYTALKDTKQQLDLTAVIDYTRQSFAASGSPLNVPPNYVPAYNVNLIGSSFGDNYIRKFTPKIVLTETAAINPAWNHPSDYNANGSIGLAIAAFKNFGFSIGVIDNYLNNPAPGFKGNSVQFNTGLTYTIAQ